MGRGNVWPAPETLRVGSGVVGGSCMRTRRELRVRLARKRGGDRLGKDVSGKQ